MNYTKGEWKAFIADHFVQVHTGKSTITLERTEENIANAQLIASAPDLYEALKELIRRDEYGSIRLPTQASDIMRQALAKVEGK